MKNGVNIRNMTPEERRALLASMLADKRARTAPAQDAPIPLSFQQERLWFLSKLLPDNSAYNIPAAVVMEAYLNPELLQQALNRVIERHSILRTAFVEKESGPVQAVLPEAKLTLAFNDLSTLNSKEQEQMTQRLAFEVAATQHDLERPPLIHARLLCHSASRYVLVLSIHHIVFDGWSMDLLFHEISTAYREAAGMGGEGLMPLRLQYHDYARRQRDPSEQGRLNEILKRRVDRLKGAALSLDLPADRPRPLTQSLRGKVHRFSLDKALVEKLEAWGRSRQASSFMTWLTVFVLLLQRLSARNDLVIGSPVANRPSPELENLIGLFVDNLVLRVQIDEAAGADALLKAVRAEVLEAMTCQELPFERLVETLGVERDMSRNPIFQVMFVHQTAAGGRARQGQGGMAQGLDHSAFHVDSGTSKFDLTLYASTGGDTAEFSLEYSSDLFEPATIERWSAYFLSLAERMAEDSALPISSFPSLNEKDEELIADWNATQQSYPGPKCLHQLIHLQAARSPKVAALICGERRLSYREMDETTDRLAHRLLAMGLGPTGHAALLLEGSIEMFIAALAVMKAGGVYVPIDPSYPQARIDAMLEDCDACVVLCTSASLGLVEEGQAPVFLVDEALDSLPVVAGPPIVDVESDYPAYMIYTSGSTGRPKGVINRHGAICNRLNWMQQAFGLVEGEAVLHKTSVSFDVSVWELFWPVICGATVVVATAEGRKDPLYLCRLIEETGITTAHFVPSLLEAFLDMPDLQMPPSLKRVICSGETLNPTLAKRFFDHSTAELYNLYGPTEAAIDVTWWRCERDAPVDEPVPIGRPLANTSIYILDEKMKQVPVGVPGELYIGGVQLADRYHCRPQTTAAAFVPDPWAELPGARMYRSGDRARFLASGAIEFIGRMDGQIKLRGHRIELGEIEHALRGALPLQSTAVVLNEQDARNKELVAYLVAEPNTELPPERDIRALLAAVLPAPMIPAFFVALDRMPLSANGKIDRRNLAGRKVVHARDGQAERDIQSSSEALIAEIWREVLDVDSIGVYDNFFEMGGHSLRVAQVAYRIRAKLGVEVALGILFERPTIAETAAYIDSLGTDPELGTDAVLAKAPRRTDLPLSFSQEHLWFLNALLPDNPFYNMPVVSRLDGYLDGAALERSLLALVDRHESLRTVFKNIEGQPLQTVVESYRPEIRFEDVSMLPVAERMRTAMARAEQEAMRPFKLDSHPPLRCLVLRLDNEQYLLLLTVHHIIADGWSIGILNSELQALYLAELEQRTAELQPLPIQFPDFAYWQRTYLQGERLEKLTGYWVEQLRDAPSEVRLPFARPRPARSKLCGALHRFSFPSQTAAELSSLCRTGRATLFMALMLGFNLLLLRYSRQADQVLGIPIANRNRPELENLVGFFVNTLVLRIDLSGDPSVSEALDRVRKVTLAAYEHQEMPFEKLVEQLRPSRNSSRNPLFNVMFAYQNIPFQLQTGSREAGLPEEEPLVVTTRSSKFDLTLFIEGEEDALRGAIEYDTELFEAENIQTMAVQLQDILSELGRDPARRVSSLLRPGPEELAQLEKWAGSEGNEDSTARRIEALFSAQVGLQPEAPAIRQGERSLSYGQLDLMAGALASRIQASALGVGDIVAVALGRGIERVAALLAVLKTGCTYLPLDPDDPADRLSFILRDSGARLLLVDAGASFRPAAIERMFISNEEIIQSDQPDPEAFGPSPGSGQAAYVIYTSGSTGGPKGVSLAHSVLAGLLAWQEKRHAEVKTTAHISSLSFDVSFQEVFCTLCSGGTLVIPEAELRREPLQLAEFVQAESVERLFLTPLALRLLAEAVDQGERYKGLQSLRQVFVAGEQLQVTAAVRRLFERLPDCRLYNQYGPSETHVVTEEEVALQGESSAPPIGRPIDHSRVYVLDESMQMLPVGAEGELYLGGSNLASGYLGKAGQSAARFLPDPFARTPGARMYRTGDRVRFLDDGRLLFLGRCDRQLKIRGYRVEPGEIENLLAEQPDIESAGVIAEYDDMGMMELNAYVAPVSGKDIQVSALRSRLSLLLPAYMLPSHIVILDSLPLLPSGKLDRRALPRPMSKRSDDAASFVGPRTPLEDEIVNIWQELLRLERVGVHDDFFALGGHSLVATQVTARIDKQLGVQISVASLFEHPTVESLAMHVLAQSLLQGEDSSSLALLKDIEEKPLFTHNETIADSELTGERG